MEYGVIQYLIQDSQYRGITIPFIIAINCNQAMINITDHEGVDFGRMVTPEEVYNKRYSHVYSRLLRKKYMWTFASSDKRKSESSTKADGMHITNMHARKR